MTGSSVPYILNKHFCAVVGSAAIDSRLQTPDSDDGPLDSTATEWLNLPVPNCLQMHRCVAIVPTLPFLHAAPNDLKALEIHKAPIPGGRSKMSKVG